MSRPLPDDYIRSEFGKCIHKNPDMTLREFSERLWTRWRKDAIVKSPRDDTTAVFCHICHKLMAWLPAEDQWICRCGCQVDARTLLEHVDDFCGAPGEWL